MKRPVIMIALAGWFIAIVLFLSFSTRIATAGAATAVLGAQCGGDFDGNGEVNFVDLLGLLSAWGICPDGDGDGVRIIDGDCEDSDPDVYPGAPELCDGKDNDCNGIVDEGFENVGSICIVGEGLCQNIGVLICDPLDPAGPPICSASHGIPGFEVCDGLDNDCDGIVDNGFPKLGSVCAIGLGDCERLGVFICDPNFPSGPPVCSVSFGPPGVEICDGLDNDCDGIVDNGFEILGSPCIVGAGECRREGVFICDPLDPTGPPVCSVSPNAPVEEICGDCLDNNCDGQIDEGCP